MGVLNPHSRGGVPGNPAKGGRGGVGTVVAIIVAVCFVGLIGTLVLRAKLGGPRFTETVAPPAPVPMPTDAGRVVGYNIELADKNDPTRVAFRLEAEAADPVGNRRYRLTRPEAWAYLKDGHAVHIRAEQGQVYVPIENQPESGTITGNVVVTFYPPGRNGQPDTAAPLGVFKTRSLTFDTNTLEISTLDAFTIESDQLQARGEGIKALFNEVRQRVEYLQITRGSSVTFTPKAADPVPVATARPKGGSPAPNAPRQPAEAPVEGAKTPVEKLYQLVLNDDVNVVQPGRTLKADRLDAWVRLLDNQLPPDAIASLKAAAGTPPSAAPRSTGPRVAPPANPPPRAASPDQPAAQDGPITLSWSGPCILRPLDSAPAELGTDHVFLRATAEKTGVVNFRDQGVGGGGQCAALEYGLTTAVLTLSGPGPTSVALALDDGWSLETARAAFDLRKLTGLVPGPGVIKGGPGTEDEGSQITWAARAMIAMTSAPGSGRRAALRQADFLGRVFATDGRASMRSDSLRAEFKPDDEGRPHLSRVVAEDKNRVVAQSDEDSRLQAEYVELGFAMGESARLPEPTMLIARGRVEAKDRSADLAGGDLEAELGRDERGKTAVRRATIRNGMTFARTEDDVRAAGDQAIVDAVKQTVDLTGAGAFVASGLTRVAGPQIRIDGEAGTIAVFGAWTIDHGEPGPDGQAPSHAQGTSGLTFDDRTGKAEGAGDVSMVHRPDELTSDSMHAERVRLEFTPRPDDPPAGSDARARPLDRKLVRAEAIGGVLENEGGANATVESRRYAVEPTSDAAPRKLIQLLYAEGPRIVADDSKGTLEIPASGILALRDHEAPPPAAPGEKPSDFRGDTRFDWDGSMRFDRAAGSVEMDRNVRVTHLRLADKQAVTLVAEHVAARGKARQSRESTSATTAPDRFDLTAASARGAVYVAVGPWTDPPTPPTRELAADLIDYDAATGLLLATAAPGNLVTVFDSTRATPASAERVTWNVGTGQIELHRAQPVVIPR